MPHASEPQAPPTELIMKASNMKTGHGTRESRLKIALIRDSILNSLNAALYMLFATNEETQSRIIHEKNTKALKIINSHRTR
jgi:hypothetical protein